MPLPAARRREVRASRRDEPNYPKKRCLNCPKFFLQTKPHKKFCCVRCKDQFNKYGGAYGPLKEKLFAEIASEVKKKIRENRISFNVDVMDRIDQLEGMVETLGHEINTCLGLIVKVGGESVPADELLKARTASPEVKKK